MVNTLRWTVLLLALTLVVPVRAADKPTPDKPMPEKKDDLASAGQVSGKIVHIEGAGKGFRIDVQISVINPQAVQNIASWQQQLAQTRDPNTARSLLQQIANQQRNMYNTQNKPLDLEPAENMIVRSKNPPVAFDDKGHPKKYTAKELKELKGDDPKLPGYTGDFDSLKMGQYVTITLAKKKDAPKPKPGAKKEDADFLGENRPVAKMVVIVADPPPSN